MNHDFQRHPTGVWFCTHCGRSFDYIVRELLTHPLALEALAADHLWWQALPPLARRVAAECDAGVPA